MADLTYDVNVNVRDAVTSLRRVQTSLKKTSKAAKATGKALGGIAKGVLSLKTGLISVAGAVGLGALIKSSLKSTDALKKTADMLGLTVNQLQKLQYVADKSGVSTEKLNTAYQRFTRRVGEVKQETGVLKDVFKSLNISLTDQEGNTKSTLQLWREYGDAIANVGDKNLQLSYTMAGVDTEGVKLINMFELGSAKIKEMGLEAESLGLIMTNAAASGVEKANDALSDLYVMGEALLDNVVALLSPAIEELSEKFIQMGKDAATAKGGWKGWASSIATSIVDAVDTATNAMQVSINAIGSTLTAMMNGVLTIMSKVPGSGVRLKSDVKAEMMNEYGRLRRGTSYAPFGERSKRLIKLESELKTAVDLPKWSNADFYDPAMFDALRAKIKELANATDDLTTSTDDLTTSSKEAVGENGVLTKGALAAGYNEFEKAEKAVREYESSVKATTDKFLPLKTATRNHTIQLIQLKYALTEGMITQKEFQTAMANLNEEHQKFINDNKGEAQTFAEGWKEAFNEYKNAAFDAANEAKTIFNSVAQSMEDAIFNFAKTGKMNFKSFAQSVIDDLLRIQSKKLAANIMGGVSNQGDNGLFAGWFAGGGIIPSGRYGVVGEAGPELVQGPANVSKAGNASVTYNINAVDAPSFQSLIARDPAFLYAVTEQGRSTLPSYG